MTHVRWLGSTCVPKAVRPALEGRTAPAFAPPRVSMSENTKLQTVKTTSAEAP